MDKRKFIRLSFAGAGVGIIAPKTVLAAGMESALKSKLAGGVFYTEDALGRWNKGVASHHLPSLDKQVSGGKAQVHVASAHPMVGVDHFIVKHELLSHDLQFMQEHIYKPTVDKTPATTFDVGGYRGVIYVLTMCNVHDVWMNMIEV